MFDWVEKGKSFLIFFLLQVSFGHGCKHDGIVIEKVVLQLGVKFKSQVNSVVSSATLKN